MVIFAKIYLHDLTIKWILRLPQITSVGTGFSRVVYLTWCFR